jgi:methionyl-tRNA formyltransferase
MSGSRGRRPLIFLGTSEFAVPSLQALADAGEEVALVVTQPDRPRGRGRRPEPAPVKEAAERLGLPLLQPERLNAPEVLERLGRIKPEVLVVAAYGQILRRAVLDLPTLGVINLHPSLLPRHRGPSPIAWTILSGDREAGNSTMLLDEGVDSGPVLLQEAFPLTEETCRGELEEKLARSGARLLHETVRRLREGSLTPLPQDESRATESGLLTREMRPIDWKRTGPELLRLIHALSPTPGALARFEGALLKVLRVQRAEGAGRPGEILRLRPEGTVVACGEGALLLTEVQPEGRRAMSAGDWARGRGIRAGSLLYGSADD